MKLELTTLQLEKIMEVLKEKWNNTHDATYLGLLHNLDSQLNWKKHKKPYVMSWLEDYFKPIENVIDPFGRSYTAAPHFMEYNKLKKSIHTEDHNVGGIKVRLHQASPMSQTKNYQVLFTILK